MSESSPLLPESAPSSHPVRRAGHYQRPGHVSLWRVVMVFILLVLPLLWLIDVEMPEIRWPGYKDPHEQHFCPQVDALYPSGELAAEVIRVLDSQKFETTAIETLSAAVKIATQTFDIMGPIGKDPAWEVFDTFQEYLRSSFPLVHKHLALTKINTYGLVYHWAGSDSSLKPILLAAHQGVFSSFVSPLEDMNKSSADTVPVNPTTVDKWTYPPWSGYYDGEFIWGRGSTDDKAGLISILLSIETLLSSHFQPHRTVVLAFGFDEEISGIQGAGKLGPYLEQTYGQDGWAIVNHRIATDSSVSALQTHYNVLLKELATVRNITFVSFGNTLLDRGTLPKIEISDAWGTALEPAPISPTDSEAFKLLSGTIIATESRGRNASEVEPTYVIPSVMSGNTDTRRYWNLTRHIYRYDHLRTTDTANIHTVDERIRATGLIGMVRFFTNLILNSDESRSL
ncbi:hypothetical protein FRC20_010416 [Serendipita sp. 405]|nr:hypothetical protein FRC20_010416 [Serendipita sp. 405]